MHIQTYNPIHAHAILPGGVKSTTLQVQRHAKDKYYRDQVVKADAPRVKI